MVDEFEGENAGLMIAEVEFEKEGQAIALPDWAGAEVTDEPRYLMSAWSGIHTGFGHQTNAEGRAAATVAGTIAAAMNGSKPAAVVPIRKGNV